jgi:hypothetical protein
LGPLAAKSHHPDHDRRCNRKRLQLRCHRPARIAQAIALTDQIVIDESESRGIGHRSAGTVALICPSVKQPPAHPRTRTFGELLIDLEEDRLARAVVTGILQERSVRCDP